MTNEEIIRVWRHCEAQKKCIDCKASIDVGHCLAEELETGDLVNRIEALMAENERLKTNAHANGTAPIVGAKWERGADNGE